MVDSELAPHAGYTIPRYYAPGDATWYHVLHGNVPNHQIDFMYCPEVPQGLLTPTHFSHLARLMKYIEPQTNASHAFAIGNLSRDDTQHEPGHGAASVIFGMRVGGATDHAGRRNPPFAHGILTVDRDLNYATLLEASATFYRHVMNAGEAHSSTGDFYREYVRSVVDTPDHVLHVLSRYVEDFDDLPRLRKSALSWDWVADEDAQPKRVLIVHPDDEAFGTVAHAAAKIGSLLYRSNIRWTSITTGREADIPGGISVHFLAERDVTVEAKRAGALVRLEALPEDEADLARELFRAKPRAEEAENRRHVGWRERYGSQMALDGDAQVAAGLPPPRRQFGSVPPAREAPVRESSPRDGARDPAREPSARDVAEHGTEIIPIGSMRNELERGHRSRPDPAEVQPGQGAGAAAEAIPARGGTGRFERPAGADALAAQLVAGAAARGAGAAAGAGAGAAARAGAAAGAGAGAGAAARAVPGGAKAPGASGPASTPASSQSWRDVAASRPAQDSAADDIEVTFEQPQTSSKAWLFVLLGLLCLGGVAAFVVPQITSGTPRPAPNAPAPAPTPAVHTAAPALAPQTSPAPPPPPGATATAAPDTEPQPPPTDTSATPGKKPPTPPAAGTTQRTGTKPPPKGKCKVFGDTLCD